MKTDHKLATTAASLAHRAPEEWAEFLSAFAAYSDSVLRDCLSSPVDALPQTQGRARACDSLLRLLVECKETADKLKDARK